MADNQPFWVSARNAASFALSLGKDKLASLEQSAAKKQVSNWLRTKQRTATPVTKKTAQQLATKASTFACEKVNQVFEDNFSEETRKWFCGGKIGLLVDKREIPAAVLWWLYSHPMEVKKVGVLVVKGVMLASIVTPGMWVRPALTVMSIKRLGLVAGKKSLLRPSGLFVR